MNKKLFIGLGALLLVGVTSIGFSVTGVKATEYNTGWSADQCGGGSVTAVDNGVKVSGLNANAKRIYRKNKVHVDGLKFDLNLSGLPKGYANSKQSCEGFYLHNGNSGMDYISETTSFVVSFWVSAQWSGQLRTFWYPNYDLNNTGQSLAWQNANETVNGFSTNWKTVVFNSSDSASYDVSFSFERLTGAESDWFKVTSKTPNSFVAGAGNKSGTTYWAYVKASDIPMDENGDAYLSTFGLTPYPLVDGDPNLNHEMTFTNLTNTGAEALANGLLQGTDIDCAADDIYLSLSTNWPLYKSAYQTLAPGQQDLIKTAKPDESSKSVLEQCSARYLQLVRKYGLEDFIGAFKNASNKINFVDNNSIIIVAAIAATAAVGSFVYFVEKKKKVSR